MQSRFFLHSLLLVNAALLVSSAAYGQRRAPRRPPTPPVEQTPPANDPATLARAAFTRGVEALEASRFADAAREFEESFRIVPMPVVQFNLAYAYRGLGRVRDAIASIESFLANPGNTPADRVTAAQEELVTLRGLLVRVRIVRTPADSQLTLDGAEATLTDGELVVDPGRHVLEVSRNGYHQIRREVEWPAQTREQMNFVLELVDIAPRLRIEPSVPNAVVVLDGTVMGRGLQEREIASGPHELRITAEGYVPFQRRIVVGRTGLHRVDAMLTQRRSNSALPWLIPTIVVGSAAVITGVSLAVYFSQPGEIPNPANQWGDPVR